MAKTQKYVPDTKYPKSRVGLGNMLLKAGYGLKASMDFLQQKATRMGGIGNIYYSRVLSNWNNGSVTEANFVEKYGDNYLGRILAYVAPETPEYQKLNDDFLAEYDKREDLQEVYKLSMKGCYYVYTIHGGYTSIEMGSPFRERPEGFSMFDAAIERCEDARKLIELSRETPYQPGDLVKLRDTSVGNSDYDPLYVSRWERHEKGDTPDKTVERIGTVITVTDKTTSWRASPGSKAIKIVWMGVGDGKVIEVPEKHLKWHMRPTYANGMKTRE